MAVSFIALLVALGGTAVALPGRNTVDAGDIKANAVRASEIRTSAVRASEIRTNAVRASEIRTNAVRTSEVRNGSLLAVDFAAGQLPAGPQGATGATGAKGDTGDTGPAGASALSPVPSGQTMRGAVGGDFHAHDADASDVGVDMTLPVPAANPLGDDEVNVNVAGQQQSAGQTPATTTDTDPGCTGSPDDPVAPPGEVCIYVAGADHAFNLEGYSVRFGAEESPYGFKLKWDVSQEGDTFVDAIWAYQAP